jgi:hypothetical protein
LRSPGNLLILQCSRFPTMDIMRQSPTSGSVFGTPTPQARSTRNACNIALFSSGEVETPLRISAMPDFRAAVNAKCKECLYDPGHGGTWRDQIEACSSPNCPLYPVRPISSRVATERKAQRQPEEIEAARQEANRRFGRSG